MFIHNHRIQFFETDLMGIVHHSNYIRYFEIARVEWFIAKNLMFDENGSNIAVLDCDSRFIRPMKFGDIASISLQVKLEGNRISFQYFIKNQNGELCCKGNSSHTLLSKDLKVQRIGPQMRAVLAEEKWIEI